jgi:hypothetical protein
LRGQLYNRLKTGRGGDHTSQEAKCQNDTSLSDAAQKVAEKAGVSPATVKRDGARVEALEKLSKAAKIVAEKATYSEVKTLAKLDSAGQDKVARAIRTGQASSVEEAVKQTGVKPPGKSPKAKPPKQYPRSHWFKQWEKAIGPVCRLVDPIAGEVKEKHDPHHEAVQEYLNSATEEMEIWMGVKRGKCPNCASTKWNEGEDGVSCAKCHHPHGEPVGDPDEDRLKTQRQKTVKTVEALMRAFDDLQEMWARPEHGGATKWTAEEVHATLADMGVISACKGLLKIARGWK